MPRAPTWYGLPSGFQSQHGRKAEPSQGARACPGHSPALRPAQNDLDHKRLGDRAVLALLCSQLVDGGLLTRMTNWAGGLEQLNHNPEVGGSSPPPATKPFTIN